MKTDLDVDTVRRDTDRLMIVAFNMVKGELGCSSDHELAARLGLSASYTHHVTGTRSWPAASMHRIAAASGRTVDALLGDARALAAAA